MILQATLFLLTMYTLPQNVHFVPDNTKGVPAGSYHADLRGKSTDKCDQIIRRKFISGFTYPWHTTEGISIPGVWWSR